MSYAKLDDIDVKVPNEKPWAMYGIIFVAFLVAIAIAVVISKFALTESSTSITASIDEIRKALGGLILKTNSQTTDIDTIKNLAKQTDVIIQGIIKDIAKNNADILTNNNAALASLNELKTASKFLKDADSMLQININTVGEKLEKFIKSIDQRIQSDKTELTNKIQSDKTELTNKIESDKTELTKKLSSDKTELTNKISSEKTELQSLIQDTIAKDKARFEAIETQIPALKKSIDILRKENDAQVKLLQDGLLQNSVSDTKYRDYVDKINTYIEIALPEVSDSFKKKLFSSTEDDIVLKMYNLKVLEGEKTLSKDTAAIKAAWNVYSDNNDMRTQYVAYQYENIMGCKPILRNKQLDGEQNFNQIMKRMKETPDNSELYELGFLFFAHVLMNEGRKITLDKTKMELIIKDRGGGGGLPEAFNKILPVLGFSPLFFISKGTPVVYEMSKEGSPVGVISEEVPDTYSYPYLTAKKAAEVFFRRFTNVKDCEPIMDTLGIPKGPNGLCQNLNDNINKLARCTS